MSLLLPQPGEVPHALAGPVTAPFWQACADGRLTFQRCADCGAIAFPPTETCRGCLGSRLDWEPSAGRATLYSWTVVHRPMSPAFVTPYAPAIVEVGEGYQMITNLVHVDTEDIAAGMSLQVSFHSVSTALTLPYFRPIRAT